VTTSVMPIAATRLLKTESYEAARPRSRKLGPTETLRLPATKAKLPREAA
jgi:hypothetical protein